MNLTHETVANKKTPKKGVKDISNLGGGNILYDESLFLRVVVFISTTTYYRSFVTDRCTFEEVLLKKILRNDDASPEYEMLHLRIDDIDRLPRQKGPEISNRGIHQPHPRLIGTPRDVGRDKAISGGEQGMISRWRFLPQNVQSSGVDLFRVQRFR